MRSILMILIIAIITMATTSLYAQEISELPGLQENDNNNIVISRDDVYVKDQLWGYIDGGADIYLEYGFDRVRVQEVTAGGSYFKTDIFRMSDKEAAFGIFSIYRRKCIQEHTFSFDVCITKYQILACKGSFYITIINNTGSESDIETAIYLLETITQGISDDSLTLPEIFANELFIPYLSNLKLMRGPLGIMNGYPAYSELFDKFPGFTLYLLPVEIEENNMILSLISFESHDVCHDFFIESKRPGSGNDEKIFSDGSDKRKSRYISPGELLQVDFIKGDEAVFRDFITVLGL